MACQDDLTSLDTSLLSPSPSLSTSSTSQTISLFPFLLLSQSHGLNLADPSHLPRLLRPVDSKDVVKTNEELEGVEGEGVWSAGCLESQEGEAEMILHVRIPLLSGGVKLMDELDPLFRTREGQVDPHRHGRRSSTRSSEARKGLGEPSGWDRVRRSGSGGA